MCFDGGNITWCSHYGKLCEVSQKVSESQPFQNCAGTAGYPSEEERKQEERKRLTFQIKIIYVLRLLKLRFREYHKQTNKTDSMLPRGVHRA